MSKRALIIRILAFVVAFVAVTPTSLAASSGAGRIYRSPTLWRVQNQNRQVLCTLGQGRKAIALKRVGKRTYIHVFEKEIRQAKHKRELKFTAKLKKKQRLLDTLCRQGQESSSSSGGLTSASSSSSSVSIPSQLSCSDSGLSGFAVAISGIRATAITSSSAVIIWTTDGCATSQVGYNAEGGSAIETDLSPDPVKQHMVYLSGLTPDTLYIYSVKSRNGSNQETVSDNHRFRTMFADTPGNYFETFDNLDFINTETIYSAEIGGGLAKPLGMRAGNQDSDFDTAAFFELEMDPAVITPSLFYTTSNYLVANQADSLNNGILVYPGGHALTEYFSGVTGRHGQALALDGGRIDVNLPLLSIEDIRLSGYSYSAWINWERPNDPNRGEGNIASLFRNDSASIQFYIDNSKHLRFNYCNKDSDNSVCSTAAGITEVSTGSWHHVAAAYNPLKKEARVYLDGRLEALTTEAVAIGRIGGVMREGIGGKIDASTAYSFKGSVDEAAILRRPISSDEAADMYNNGLPESILRFGNFESYPIDMGGRFNTLRLTVEETNPGASQVFIWQAKQWQRIRGGEVLILDMPGRMPLNTLRYKVNFAAATELQSIKFEWENKNYAPAGDEFTFLVVADTFQSGLSNALKFAYETYPDMAMIFHNEDMAGPTKEDIYATTAAQWNQNPNFPARYIPYFLFQGNHDAEIPRGVDFAVRGIGSRLTTSLPGMRNFKPGPFDVYPAHGNYEDRNLQYSFEYGNSLFIVVNSYFHDLLLDPAEMCSGSCSVDRFNGAYGTETPKYAPQGCISDASTVGAGVFNTIDWLEDVLRNSSAAHKFVFYHEPAFPTPSPYHHGDSWDNAECPGNNRYAEHDYVSRPMRDKLWALFARYKVSATFSGHEHIVHPSFVADPTGEGNSLYEIKPGPLANVRNFAIVHVNGAEASVHQYMTTSGQFDFQERFEPILINHDPSQPNYPPKLKRYELIGESYSLSEESNYIVEEGMQMNSRPIILEATDNNVDDEISFVVAEKPSFMSINDEGHEFRRITFSSSTLTAADVGTHRLTVVASDGRDSDSMTLTIMIKPATAPEVIGSFIKSGQSFNNLASMPFVCSDNVSLSGWDPPAPDILITDGGGVKRRFCMGGEWAGENEECGDVPGTPSGTLGWYRSYDNSLLTDEYGVTGTKSVIFRNDYGDASHVPPIPPNFERPPGSYQVTNVCRDEAGHASSPLSVQFEIIPDGLPLEAKPPWVVGALPHDGAVVPELKRILLLIQSYNCCNHLTLSEITLTKDGQPLEGVERQTMSDGIIEITFAQPTSPGTYQITVVPKAATGSGSLVGTPYSATIVVSG